MNVDIFRHRSSNPTVKEEKRLILLRGFNAAIRYLNLWIWLVCFTRAEY